MSNLSDRGTLTGTLSRGNGGSTVSITPIYNSGVLIMDYTIDGIEGHVYIPDQETDVEITPAVIPDPKMKIADYKIDNVTGELYAPIVEIEGNASGAIASFPDGANNKPLKSLKVAINPVQEGSGDPSPSNVRPISGWSSVGVRKNSGNFWDEEWEVGTISTSTGEYSASGDRVCSKNYIRVEPNELYYKQNFAWQFYYDEYKNFISATSIADGVFTTPNNAHYMKFYTSSTYGTTYNNDISINYPSTDTTYHAYNGTTTTIPLGQTVYGGELDVTSGVLTVTHANIASYNGESINEPWISSEDAYESGATPTTGAQVVYPLTTPLTVQLTPTQVKSLLGNNNIWSDTGDIEECIYIRDLNIVINKLLEQ